MTLSHPGKARPRDSILNHEVTVDNTNPFAREEKNATKKFRRMTNYAAAAMVFFKDNVLLEWYLTVVPENLVLNDFFFVWR
jgi:hypothetical protein